jgi:type II secretory pathway component PulJ
MKKSFSFIELLISIVILSIVIFGISEIINNLQITQKKLHNNFKNSIKDIAVKVLYYDILNGENFILKQTKNKTTILLQTTNSLYNIPKPYIKWYLLNNTLTRIESPTELNQTKMYYKDTFFKVTIFKIYKKNNRFFIYLANDKPIFFEILQ